MHTLLGRGILNEGVYMHDYDKFQLFVDDYTAEDLNGQIGFIVIQVEN